VIDPAVGGAYYGSNLAALGLPQRVTVPEEETMGKAFSELVIDGHFILVKGFLMGFWSATEPQPEYFFHRNTGIHQETFKDLIAEYFELDDQVSICLEEEFVPAFQRALARAEPIIGLTIKSCRHIQASEFRFSFHVFSPEMGDECKSLFASPPAGVQLEAYEPVEEVREGGKSDPNLHAYEYQGEGVARGEFVDIMNLYLRCKRSRANDLITTKDMELTLAS
jgi:hypothetical protein